MACIHFQKQALSCLLFFWSAWKTVCPLSYLPWCILLWIFDVDSYIPDQSHKGFFYLIDFVQVNQAMTCKLWKVYSTEEFPPTSCWETVNVTKAIKVTHLWGFLCFAELRHFQTHTSDSAEAILKFENVCIWSPIKWTQSLFQSCWKQHWK